MQFAFCLSLIAKAFNGVEQKDISKMNMVPQRQRMYCDFEHICEITKFMKVFAKGELK